MNATFRRALRVAAGAGGFAMLGAIGPGCASAPEVAPEPVQVVQVPRPAPDRVIGLWDEAPTVAVDAGDLDVLPPVDEDDLLEVELEEEFADVLPPELEPETEAPWDPDALARFVAARRAMVSGQLEAARRELAPIRDHEDHRVRGLVRHNEGVLAFYSGRPGEAEESFRAALNEDPALGASLAALVRSRLSAGDRSGAQRLVDDQLAASDRAAGIRAVGLLIHLHDGQDSTVEREVRELMLQDGANLDLFEALALTHLNARRYALATYIVERGLERDPTRTELWFLRARILIAQGGTRRAIEMLEGAIERGTNRLQPELLNLLGTLYLETLQWEDARRVQQKAVELAPGYEYAWLNLGNAYRGLGQHEEALAAYERALQENPATAEALFNIGLLHMEPAWEIASRETQLETAIGFFDRFLAEARGVDSSHRVHEYREEAQSTLESARMFGGAGGGDRRGRTRERPATACDDPFGCDDVPACDDPFGCDDESVCDDPFGCDDEPVCDDPFGCDDEPVCDDPFGCDDDAPCDDPFGCD